MNLIFIILCLVLLSVLCIYYMCTRRDFYKLMAEIPGPRGYPFIGIAHKLLHKEGFIDLVYSFIEDYGTTFLTWLGPFPLLIVSDPQVTQDILTSPDCVNKCFVYKAIDEAIGLSLFTLDDPRWSEHKKLLKPAFGHKVLLSFLPIFNSETGLLLKEFDMMVDGTEKKLVGCLQKLMLSIATQTTMGSCVKQEPSFKNSSLMEYYQCVQEIGSDIVVSPWLKLRILRQLLGKEKLYFKSQTQIKLFIRKLIKKRLSGHIHDETFNNKNSYLNLAIEQLKRGKFNCQNVEDETSMLVFAAFETSAKTVAYTLMLLAMFPEYQEKAFEEIKTLFPETGDFSVSYEDIQQMVYMDLVLNECMRVIAPIPFVARQTSNAVRLSNGVCLPKGVQIALDIFHMQRSKEIWGPDAETFNPDHFLPHNIQEKHCYAFIPFTKGIRSCIGWHYALLAIKVTMAKLLRNYRFSTSFKFEDLQFVENVTTKLAIEPHLKLERRI